MRKCCCNGKTEKDTILENKAANTEMQWLASVLQFYFGD